MKRVLYGICLVCMSLFGFSCEQGSPDEPQGEEAWLRLSVDEKLLPVVQITRAAPASYHIRVTDGGGAVVYSCDDHTAITEPIRLKTGRYTVTAFSCAEPESSFDDHYYYAAETVDMVGGQQQNINLVCRLGGVLVSAVFDETLRNTFPGYSVEVTNGEPDDPEAAPLRFDDRNEGAKGYLRCSGTLTYCVTLTNGNGSEFKFKTTLRDGVEANQHYIFRFRSGEGEGGETVDESMGQHEYLVDLGLGLDKVAPAITESNGADLSQPVLVVTGAAPDFGLVVDAPAEINAMTITHDSDALAAMGLPRSFKPIRTEGAALAAINDLGLSWGEIEHRDEAAIDFTDLLGMLSDPLSGLGEGDYTFTVWVEDHHGQTVEQTVVFAVSHVQPDVATVAVPSPEKKYVWARFATLFGRWLGDPQPAGIGFRYRKVGETAWTAASGTPVPDGDKGFSMRVTGLEPNTRYEYMAVSDITLRTTVQRFTTEGAEQLHNLSFDAWSGGYANPVGYNYGNPDWVWDSGNDGAKSAGKTPTTEETSIVVSGSAVKMKTEWAMITLAAGNIYSGKFGTAIFSLSNPGAELDFGRPYPYRPTSMTGYYRYEPVTVNRGSHAGMNGQQDRCAIYIALMADRTAAFRINTQTGTFIDTSPGNMDGVIAFGELPAEECAATTGPEANGYKKFTIDLTYYDPTKTPSHVVVVASSSKYGDYFTGGEGSVLYIDEFSFGFDPVD